MGEPPRVLLAVACLLALSVPLGVAPAEISLGLGLLVIAVSWATGRRFWTPSPVDLPLLAFLASGFVSAAFSAAPAPSSRAALSGWTLLAFWIAKEAATDERAVRWILRSLLLGAVTAAAVGILQAVLGDGLPDPLTRLGIPEPTRGGRASGFFSHPMTFAGSQSILLVMFAAPFAAASRGLVPRMAAAAAMAAALVASATRGAFAAALAALAAIAALGRGRRQILLGAATTAMLAAVALTGGTLLADRFANVDEEGAGPGRADMWLASLEMLRERPLVGVGPGGYRRLVGARLDVSRFRPAHAHSTPFQVAATRGMVGLSAYVILWASFYAGTVPRMWRMRSRGDPRSALLLGSVLGVSTFLLVGLLEFNLGDSEVAMLVTFVAGLPFGRAFYGRRAVS